MTIYQAGLDDPFMSPSPLHLHGYYSYSRYFPVVYYNSEQKLLMEHEKLVTYITLQIYGGRGLALVSSLVIRGGVIMSNKCFNKL